MSRPGSKAPAGQKAPRQQAFQAAIAHLQAQRLGEADRLCQNILAADPGFTPALHLRGVIAFRAGRVKEAVELLNAALAKAPGDANILSDLGMIFTEIGLPARAEAALSAALERDPKLAAAHLNLGKAEADLGRPWTAETHFREAIRLAPDFSAARTNLSHTLLTLGRATEAVTAAKEALAANPRDALAQSRLGAALARLNRREEALAAHQAASALAPKDETIALAHIQTLANFGLTDQAEAQTRTLLAARPRSARAYANLAALTRFSEGAPEIARMQDLFKAQGYLPADRARIGFALGKAQEDIGRFDEAFAAFTAANALVHQGLPHSRAATDARFDDIETAFSAQNLARLADKGDPDPTPIFVIGMPRSGTSLVEQILSSHPEIEGAGELSTLSHIAHRLRTKTGAKTLTEAVGRAGPGVLKALGADYAAILRTYSDQAAYIVDKMPANFLHVGLIRLILPNAKIVHCRRAPADTALSIYKNMFNTGALSYAYDTADLGHYYRRYQGLMDHWHKVLPGAVTDLDYEALVADQEETSRALLDRLGLDWTDKVLSFHQTDRAVQTASLAQVRQPIYQSSVGLAQKYGEAAAPLLAALTPEPKA